MIVNENPELRAAWRRIAQLERACKSALRALQPGTTMKDKESVRLALEELLGTRV